MCKSEGVCGCGEECAAFGEECDSKKVLVGSHLIRL